MMAYVFKDDYEMTMLQVNQAVLTRLMEGAQHDDVDDACIHSLYSRALLEVGGETVKTSPVTSAGDSDLTAELFRVVAKTSPHAGRGGLLRTSTEAAGLLPDCTS